MFFLWYCIMVRAIIYAMNVRVDKAGRLVLPKAIRQRLGLKNGGRITLEEGPEGVTLRPAKTTPKFANEHGVLVYVGDVPKDFDWERFRDDEREARLRELWER
ncbi:MAG: hypothetical protein DMG60_20550 [Acidobacteria bacterium]|nr:MAG: hypothetical protein DMG60_20550 [Acidobacteriota bacterium]